MGKDNVLLEYMVLTCHRGGHPNPTLQTGDGDQMLRVHMSPGNLGFFPLHFLHIFWPHYSLFIRENNLHYL